MPIADTIFYTLYEESYSVNQDRLGKAVYPHWIMMYGFGYLCVCTSLQQCVTILLGVWFGLRVS